MCLFGFFRKDVVGFVMWATLGLGAGLIFFGRKNIDVCCVYEVSESQIVCWMIHGSNCDTKL